MATQPDSTDTYSNVTTASKPTRPSMFSDKKMMAITTATILAGGSALAWGMSGDRKIGSSKNPTDSAPSEADLLATGQPLEVAGGTITPTAEIPIGVVNDRLSFDEAFRAARTQTGPGGVFTWHGEVYNTYQKEEWMGLSLPQRQEFLSDVGFKPTHSSTSVSEQPASTPYLPDSDPEIEPQPTPEAEPEPIIKDVLVNGQRIIGFDFDHDGMIDLIVVPGADGQEIRIFDSEGGDELDRVVTIDPYTQEVVSSAKLPDPVAMTNNQFEARMHSIYDSLPEQQVARETEASEMTYVTASDDTDDTDEDGTPDYQPNAENEL